MAQENHCHCQSCNGHYVLLNGGEEDPRLAKFDRPLPCCGCGIGWCSLLLGFLCPLIWFYAAILYFCKYYNNDPRERVGLGAAATAAIVFSIVVILTVIILAIIYFVHW